MPSMPPVALLRDRMEAVHASGTFTNFGPFSMLFEARLAERLGVPVDHVCAVTSATAGLAAALMAVAGDGGLCAMPAWTHAATAAAVRIAGLQPYFLDVDPVTWQLDPERLTGRLAKAPGRVTAVLMVAPFGSRIDVPGWAAFQQRSRLPVVVDAAAGFDSWTDSPLVSVVSFHATKGFAIGEGGAALCPTAELGWRLRATINLGMDAGRVARIPGLNGKLDEHRSVIGLAALEAWPETRSVLAARMSAYDRALERAGLAVTRPAPAVGVVTSTYVVELAAADAVRTVDGLARHGVQARRWWGDGCHRAPAFAGAAREALTATDRLAARVVGLPLHAALSFEDVDYVVACLGRVLDGAGEG